MKQKLIFLTILLTALSAFSTEYFADASRPDDTGAATNWATAKKTIQAAVDLTVNGDTVWVTNGTYSLSAGISITNAITVQSINGPMTTLVKGQGTFRCLTMTGAGQVCGLSIQNGYSAQGGGAWIKAGGVLSSCIFSSNIASNQFGGYGGGVFLDKGGLVENSLFYGNYAKQGGGACISGRGTLNHCTISGNTAKYNSGGVHFDLPLSLQSGGVVSDNDSLHENTLNNCVVWGNTVKWNR